MTADDFRAVAPGLLAAGRFASRLPLSYREGAEATPWEEFQGRLVPTRAVRRFESWSVFVGEAELLSLKLDGDRVHVVRGVEGYVQEPHDTPDGLETREARRWQRELIATLSLDTPGLANELVLALQRAVWGSRLPLTAEESPHPLFSQGLLAYGVSEATPSRRAEAWLRMLRPTPEALREAWGDDEGLYAALRGVFDDVSLSPWTDLVPRLLDAVEGIFPPERVADFLSSVTLLVTRHLTAYDLHTFHHRGANYPDALLLEELLGRMIRVGRFDTVRRRAALRQGWILRREYEGHPVPDAPTSPGEWLRVYPGGRVPEAQLTETRARTRRLFVNPLSVPEEALRLSIDDLRGGFEELGAAVYLDRPLSDGKRPVEPDGTPVVASLAYSRAVAARRWRLLTGEGAPDLTLPGLALEKVAPPSRLGTVSLLDAARVSPDFVFRRTLSGSLRRLGLDGAVVARSAGGLTLYDAGWREIRSLRMDYSRGYVWRDGVEWPAGWEARRASDAG